MENTFRAQAPFTIDELAQRWNCTKEAVRQRERDGLLKRCVGLPGVRFRAKEVYELEGMSEKDLNPHTPFEWRRMRQNLDAVRKENGELRARLAQIAIAANTYMAEKAREVI